MSALSDKQLLNRSVVGFWLYLMSDGILFASLFATYVVLSSGTAGGVGPKDIISLPFVLAETIILLTSSLTGGLAVLAARFGKLKAAVVLLIGTFALGVSFLTIEISEFSRLVSEGHGPASSAFLSGFFTLVGTHGLHITFGLLWLVVLLITVIRGGLNPRKIRQLTLFSLFWHFLDLIWIFIFTVVYLGGSL